MTAGCAPPRRQPIALLLFCLGGLLLGCGGSAAQTSSREDPATTVVAAEASSYTDSSGKFTVKVPAQWSPPTSQSGVTTWLVDDPIEGFQDSVNVAMETLPQDVSLVEYAEQLIGDAPNRIENFQLQAAARVLLSSGAERVVMNYSATVGETPIRALSYVAVAGTNASTITLTSAESRYGKRVAAFDQYLQSLQIRP